MTASAGATASTQLVARGGPAAVVRDLEDVGRDGLRRARAARRARPRRRPRDRPGTAAPRPRESDPQHERGVVDASARAARRCARAVRANGPSGSTARARRARPAPPRASGTPRVARELERAAGTPGCARRRRSTRTRRPSNRCEDPERGRSGDRGGGARARRRRARAIPRARRNGSTMRAPVSNGAVARAAAVDQHHRAARAPRRPRRLPDRRRGR